MITIVMAYFENGGMLDLHLAEWDRYANKDQWRIVLVDDCSKRDPALPHIRNVGIPISLYRISSDIPWNWDGARNLAMKHTHGWCLMTDMDHMLTATNAANIQSLRLEPDKHYTFSRVLANGRPYKPHPNSWLMHNDLFWRAGGYDERYRGYYGKDSFFRSSIVAASGQKNVLDIPLVLYGREVQKDASTVDYGRKDSKYYLRNLPCKGESLPPKPQLDFEWERQL